MTIEVGETIPDINVFLATDDGPAPVHTQSLFANNTVVLFGVPGPFTPTCSAQHLPSYIQQADALKAKGADSIICMSVNDGFVMNAWAHSQGAANKVHMIADGDATLTKAMGLEFDLNGKGFGLRCKRFAAIIEDCRIDVMKIDAPGAYEVTSAESMLDYLKG